MQNETITQLNIVDFPIVTARIDPRLPKFIARLRSLRRGVPYPATIEKIIALPGIPHIGGRKVDKCSVHNDVPEMGVSCSIRVFHREYCICRDTPCGPI